MWPSSTGKAFGQVCLGDERRENLTSGAACENPEIVRVTRRYFVEANDVNVTFRAYDIFFPGLIDKAFVSSLLFFSFPVEIQRIKMIGGVGRTLFRTFRIQLAQTIVLGSIQATRHQV